MNNIYGLKSTEAVSAIKAYHRAPENVIKAAIIKQTLINDYEGVRFWSGVSLPELPEGDFTDEDFESGIEALHFEWEHLQDLQDLQDSELSDLEKVDLEKYSELCEKLDESRKNITKWLEDFIASLSITELVEIFDNMDHRFNTWATPPRAMIRELNV